MRKVERGETSKNDEQIYWKKTRPYIHWQEESRIDLKREREDREERERKKESGTQEMCTRRPIVSHGVKN